MDAGSGVGYSHYRFDRLSVMVIDDNRHMLNLISEILRGLSIRAIKKGIEKEMDKNI